MSDKKLFDIHIEVGNEVHNNFYARTVIGNSVEFKHVVRNSIFDVISMVLNDLIVSGVFTSLTRDPSKSSFPFPSYQHYNTTVITPGGGHSHNVGNPTAGPQPLFELHFEMGKGAGGGYYAKAQFMKPFIEYRKFRNQFMEDAANDLLMELEDQGVLIQLMSDPKMSTFPFLSPSSSTSSSSSTSPPKEPAKKVDFKRELPSACIGYADIECRDHCTSWDFFGETKCGNMCSWRKKI
jgi:hypothetical protein